MRVCTFGYAAGAPRVSRPAHGVLLVPPRSLPPSAAATKTSFDGFLWSVLHQQVAHYIFLIQRCSQPSTVVPLCGEGRGERSRSRWSKQSQLADSTVFTTLNSFQRCCSLACLVFSRCSRHKAQFPLRGAPRKPKNSSSPPKETQNSVMKVIKSFPKCSPEATH